MGVGVGLAAGPSTAAILEFSSHQDAKRAASLTMMAQAGGFSAALLLGGALTEYGPWPTRLCFWSFAVPLATLTIATWFLPRHTARDAEDGWRPRMPFVPKNMRRAFTTSSAAMMAAYAAKTIAASDTCRPSKKAGSAAVRNRVIYFLPRW
jgi:MFS family permease